MPFESQNPLLSRVFSFYHALSELLVSMLFGAFSLFNDYQALSSFIRNFATNLQQDKVNQQSLRRRIETAARKAGSLDPEILFLDIANEHRPSALLEQHYALFPDVDINTYAQDFAMWAQDHPTRFFADIYPLYIYCSDGVLHATAPSTEASVITDYATTEANSLDGINLKCLDVYLPAWRWAIVATIISATANKGQSDQTAPLGETVFRKIAYFANTVADNAEFARLVGRILIRANGLEQNESSEEPTNLTEGINLADLNFATKGKCTTDALTWRDICVAALETLGGHAHTSSIYPACRRIAHQLSKPITNKNDHSFDMRMQGTLENSSHDCHPTTKYDHFHIAEKGTGMWQLNPGVHFDWQSKKATIKE